MVSFGSTGQSSIQFTVIFIVSEHINIISTTTISCIPSDNSKPTAELLLQALIVPEYNVPLSKIS